MTVLPIYPLTSNGSAPTGICVIPTGGTGQPLLSSQQGILASHSHRPPREPSSPRDVTITTEPVPGQSSNSMTTPCWLLQLKQTS